MPHKYPYRIYFWMVPNPTTGRLRKTRYRMSEADAAQYAGAVRVEYDWLEISGPGEGIGIGSTRPPISGRN